MADPLPPHVLVVDDDPVTRDLAARVLGHFGWRVTAREGPDLAPQEVAGLAPDVVALDYWFGREPLALPFLERLRAHPATASLPVLLTSAVLAVQRDRERIDALADAVLPKPFGVAELRGAVEGLLARR